MGVGHAPGQVRAQPGAQGRPQGEDRHRHRPFQRPEIVRDQGGGRRCRARFADPDPDPRDDQLPEVAGYAGGDGHGRPEHQRYGHNVAPAAAVGQHRHRQADRHIEEGEDHPGQEGDAGVGQVQLQPDRFQHGGDHITVGDIDGVDQHHHRKHIPAIAAGGRQAGRGRSGRGRQRGGLWLDHACLSQAIAKGVPARHARSSRLGGSSLVEQGLSSAYHGRLKCLFAICASV